MRARVLSFLFVATIAAATSAYAADVTAKDAWFRALPAGLPAGGYFTLHNSGKSPITLIGAESSACGMLMLHKSEDKGGMSAMIDMPSVAIPVDSDLKFAPGGDHLMCTNPTPALKAGAAVPVTLLFAGGAKLNASFTVRNARGQ
jgi:copper(I)-binding protein